MSISVNKNSSFVVETAILAELEAALLEYVERYGLSDRARTVLQKISHRKANPDHID